MARLQLDTTTIALDLDTPVRILASGGMGADYFGLIALTGESISKGGGWQTTISLIDPESGALVQKKWRTDFLEVIEEFELIEEEIEELEKIRCAIQNSKDLACLAASVDLSDRSTSPDLTNESKLPNSSKSTHTVSESLPNTIPTPQSTTTSAVSTQNQDSSISFSVDFPARTSPLLEEKQELKEQDRDFSESLAESSSKLDQNLSSLKMSETCSQDIQTTQRQSLHAYAAGLLDGEGCISITKKKENEKTYYSLRVLIQMSFKAKPILSLMHTEYGGSFYRRKERLRTNQAETWVWQTNGHQAAKVLLELLPYLKLKKAHAIFAIELMQILPKHKELTKTANWEKKASQIFDTMKTLNRHGIPTQEDCLALLVGERWYKPQCSLLDPVGLEPYLESFPTSGTMRSGKLFLAQKWEESTSAIASGSSLIPTPTASDATMGAILNENTQITYTKNGTPRKISNQGVNGSVGLSRFVSLLPTPKATDGIHPGVQSHRQGQTLHLSAAVQNLPTPTARDWKHGSANQVERERSENLNDRMAAVTGKPRLNVNFVEKMMGYPPNWTQVDQPITSSDTTTLSNGYQEQPTAILSPTVKNDSSPSVIASFPQSPRSPGEESPILLELPDELTEDEERDLKRLETKVERAFYEAGSSLREIRDKRLYRGKYKTFEAYCKERFGFTRQTASLKILAVDVVDGLSTNGCQILPTNERQIRPITNLQPSQRNEVWQIAVDEAGGKLPTGAAVKGIVERITERDNTPPVPEYCEGDVVEIRSGYGSTISKHNGCWGIITHVGSWSYQVHLSLRNEDIQCKGMELERIDDQYTAEIKAVSERIKVLRECDLDATEYLVLQSIAKSICFTSKQMNLLQFLEGQYGISNGRAEN